MKTVVALLGVLCLQEPPTRSVGKSSAAPYRAAVKTCQEAESALASGDFSLAAEKAGSVLEDKRVEQDKRECLLRVQNDDSTWPRAVEFFPARARGRALLGRAKKQLADGNRDAALLSLNQAVRDLEESKARNVPGSAESYKEASDLIARHSSGDDPAARKRRAYDDKVKQALQAESDKRYADARRLYEEALAIDAEGADAKKGVEKMAQRLREEEAYQGVLRAKPADKQLAACDEFLRNFADGERREEVSNLRERLNGEITRALGEREAEFKGRWNDLVAERRFKSALDCLRSDGAFLPAERKKWYEDRTRSACGDFVGQRLRDFRSGLKGIDSPADVAALPDDWIARDLALPDGAELVIADPTLDWCRSFREVLVELRKLGAEPAPAAVLDLVGRAWRASPALVPEGENPFFRVLAGLVREPAARRLRGIVEEGRSAPNEGLAKLEQEGRALLARLDAFDACLGEALGDRTKEWRDRHSFWAKDLGAIKAILDEFPRDDPRVAATAARLLDANVVCGDNPAGALKAVEDDLFNLHGEKRKVLTLDCRRRLLTAVIVAAAQRVLLEGNSVADAAKFLHVYAGELKNAGGPAKGELEKFGPKVRSVVNLALGR